MKRLLITGISQGIGLHCAKRLCQKHKIVGISRTTPKDILPNTDYISCDLEKLHSRSCLDALLGKYDIDGAIFCAGKGLFCHVEQASYKQVQNLFALNFFHCVFLTQYLLPKWKKKTRADLIFLSSVAATKYTKKNAFYGASKAALEAFVKSLRQECSSTGVKISLITPGMCQTNFYNQLDFQPKQEPFYALDPEDIAKTIEFVLAATNTAIFEEIRITAQKQGIEKKPHFS